MSDYDVIIQKLDAIGTAQVIPQLIFNIFHFVFATVFDAFYDFVDWIQNFLADYSFYIFILGFGILLILTLKWLSRW